MTKIKKWPVGSPEARRQSKENRKSKSRGSKWPAGRQKGPWQTKKEPGRLENQRREPEIGQPDPRKRGDCPRRIEKASREEANGQLPGKKSYGRPRKRLAGRKVRTTSPKMVSRIPGSSEMESMLDISNSCAILRTRKADFPLERRLA